MNVNILQAYTALLLYKEQLIILINELKSHSAVTKLLGNIIMFYKNTQRNKNKFVKVQKL